MRKRERKREIDLTEIFLSFKIKSRSKNPENLHNRAKKINNIYDEN
jgi:hypothetical protein